MVEYEIKEPKKDFAFSLRVYNIKGSRKKRMGHDNNKRLFMFKYERADHTCSEACSEK